MTSYFPLLPNIDLPGKDQTVTGSLCIANISSNYNLSSKTRIKQTPKFLATYKLCADSWELISVDKCPYGEFVHIKRSSLDVSPRQMVVSFFRNTNDFPLSPSILPLPQSLRVDRSPVAERAALEFSLGHSTTSYQGEYPLAMANLSKGSFWSFDALSHNNSDNIYSFIILMNLNRNASKQGSVPLSVVTTPKCHADSLNLDANLNSFTVISSSDTDNSNNNSNSKNAVKFLTCKNAVFIPMTLNIDLLTSQLSLEHTHPPVEMLWGRDKFIVVKELKRLWLS